MAAMEEADAAVVAAALSKKLEDVLHPEAEDNAVEDPQGGEGNL